MVPGFAPTRVYINPRSFIYFQARISLSWGNELGLYGANWLGANVVGKMTNMSGIADLDKRYPIRLTRKLRKEILIVSWTVLLWFVSFFLSIFHFLRRLGWRQRAADIILIPLCSLIRTTWQSMFEMLVVFLKQNTKLKHTTRTVTCLLTILTVIRCAIPFVLF